MHAENRQWAVGNGQREREKGWEAAALAVCAAGLLAALVASLVAAALSAFAAEPVAPYSVCEMCGLVLDDANVHGRCAGEEASHAR